MKKTLLMIALVLSFGITAAAQSATQANSQRYTEFYAGYQFLRVNPNFRSPSFTFNRSTDSNGANVSGTGYLTQDLGVTAELAGNFTGGTHGTSTVTLMGGLTLKARGQSRFQPFVRALAGGARTRVTNEQIHNVFDRSDVAFAYAFGTGLDINVHENSRVKIRLFQADYLNTRFGGSNVPSFRLGTGIVF